MGTGIYGRLGDGGPATAAQLSGPRGVTIAPNGDLYIVDTESCKIRKARNSVVCVTDIVDMNIVAG